LLTRDGARKSVEVTLNPIVLEGRSMVITTVFDITGRRQQEREQAMQRAALAHVARVGMLAELSGSLAHEINQPLAAILSNAQASQRFLGRDSPDLGEVREGLVEIVDSAKRAGEVIRRLRAMLRNDPPEFTAIDVRRKVREVIQLLHSELVDRHAHVVEAFADDLPLIRGDRIQLQQVLINLIVNAADAMMGVSGERTLTLTVQRHADGVLIQVSDVGTGIPETEFERIFQAFVSTKSDGLGFGLPLCRTLVQAHGGRLWASNNHGPGATFHVLLPAAE
jgi:C4-dicarboxylate-specific signal transduction histidine kinase